MADCYPIFIVFPAEAGIQVSSLLASSLPRIRVRDGNDKRAKSGIGSLKFILFAICYSLFAICYKLYALDYCCLSLF